MEEYKDFCDGTGLGIYLEYGSENQNEINCGEIIEDGTFIGSDGVQNQNIPEDYQFPSTEVWPHYPPSEDYNNPNIK
ncbi:MAG: hypothetical protein J1F35_05795 [Erysipelotrichales bacterium]|nr:hypothetical protein [Erysipelotrichales bacterium]